MKDPLIFVPSLSLGYRAGNSFIHSFIPSSYTFKTQWNDGTKTIRIFFVVVDPMHELHWQVMSHEFCLVPYSKCPVNQVEKTVKKPQVNVQM